ncbi:MAG: hypothetical protein GF411_10135 [Candidatus Lokiarchaeota archaeon]|nr:hypothetical protein [Candidatus Lokiarchaeota archaeon]
MARAEKSKIQTPSTVEAIRMASASVLGSTTSQGFPLGSAIGSGSMMQQNSDSVALNITPLIFLIRDGVLNSEGLELLSVEWDLDHVPGPDVLPEQLIISGGQSEGVGSHVCVLSWEKGVVDPFKIDDHMKRLAKKISDIEQAIVENDVSYDTDGLTVLRRFNDRLNNVIYVQMMDRQFQGSWDSLILKPEHVDNEAIIKLSYIDDFTMLPPGPKIVKRLSHELLLPTGSEEEIIEHFRHRILTPTAIHTLAQKVPEIGRAILSEVNTYAYSAEEVDIARVAIESLSDFIGTSVVTVDALQDLRTKASDFVNHLVNAVDVFSELVEAHITSGKQLTLDEHKETLLEDIRLSGHRLEGIEKNLANGLAEEIVESAKREMPIIGKIRAWQLKSIFRYFLAYCKRISQYFAEELSQYIVVTAARKVFLAAMQEFRSENTDEKTDEMSAMLFEKFYGELFLQLNAVFDRKAFEGSRESDFAVLMQIIAKDMSEAFKDIDIWSLIKFSDIAKITRAEIVLTHAENPESEEIVLSDWGQKLEALLTKFETLVADVIPDIADTLLSKPLIRRIILKIRNEDATLVQELMAILDDQKEKPEEWIEEAWMWIETLNSQFDDETPLSKQLMDFQRFVHNKVGEGVTARAIAGKVEHEANVREQAYQAEVDAWQAECDRIEEINKPIREHNARRAELLSDTRARYSAEKKTYQEQLEKYEKDKSAYDKAYEEYRWKLAQHQDVKRKYEELLELSKTDPTTEVPPPPPPPPKEPTELPRKPVEPPPLEPRLRAIEEDYPLKQEQPLPEKPEPSEEMLLYVDLRDLLNEKLLKMDSHQDKMESLFAERLDKLAAEGTSATKGINISIGEEFLEFMMNSVMRGLGRLLPRPTRAYLRDPKVPGLIYLVTYEIEDCELTVTIGNNYLKMDGGN